MITIHNDTQAALDSDSIEYYYLCELPVNLKFTNHANDLTIGSDTYLSNALLMDFAAVKKDQNMNVGSYTLNLSNVDTTVSQAYMTQSYRGEAASIYIALLSNGVVQGDPILMYKGTIDTWAVEESRTNSQLQIKLTSHWASYNKKSGFFTNDTLHQQRFSNDAFFKYAHEDISNIGWGK